MFEKWRKIPFRLNRQRFNEDNTCIQNLELVTDMHTYFSYIDDERRKHLKEEILTRQEDTDKKKEKVIAHAYWYGEIGRKQAFSILSYLATQDLSKTEVWLWLDEESGYTNYEQNAYLKELIPYIKVKKYNPKKELKGVPCFNRIIFTQKDNLAYRADGFRLLALYKYGGLYFDLDICFLENILCICGKQDWCYGWEKQAYANNALLYFPKDGEQRLIQYLFFKAQRKAPMPWAILNYKDQRLRNLIVYPYQIFDPAWLNRNNEATDESFDRFFQQDGFLEEFYPGAFAYHWHNRWEMAVENGSNFAVFEKRYWEILKEKVSTPF